MSRAEIETHLLTEITRHMHRTRRVVLSKLKVLAQRIDNLQHGLVGSDPAAWQLSEVSVVDLQLDRKIGELSEIISLHAMVANAMEAAHLSETRP